MRVYRVRDGWQISSRCVAVSASGGVFWVRFWPRGRGVAIIDSRKAWVPFSIRHGYQRSMRVGPYIAHFIEAQEHE